MPTFIVNFLQLGPSDRIKVLKEIQEIFFESSTKKDFKDQGEREQFFQKYMGYYLSHYPEQCWVAQSEQVLGYILGASNTNEVELLRLQPHLELFKDYFSEFPAHLHINCHAQSRGRGVGSSLMGQFEEQLKILGVKGVHIMTGPDSPNVSFYLKLGYRKVCILEFKHSPILLMGKVI